MGSQVKEQAKPRLTPYPALPLPEQAKKHAKAAQKESSIACEKSTEALISLMKK
jgi:hypothetical protein